MASLQLTPSFNCRQYMRLHKDVDNSVRDDQNERHTMSYASAPGYPLLHRPAAAYSGSQLVRLSTCSWGHSPKTLQVQNNSMFLNSIGQCADMCEISHCRMHTETALRKGIPLLPSEAVAARTKPLLVLEQYTPDMFDIVAMA